MKCEYCNGEREQIETEDYEKVWICSCSQFEKEQELKKKIYCLECELRITQQKLCDVQRKSNFVEGIIKLNETYGKHVMC